MGYTKQRAFIDAVRGATSMKSSSPRWNGSIGSTIDAYSNRSDTFRPSSWSRHTMIVNRLKRWPLESHSELSGKCGTIHWLCFARLAEM